ncbi:MAG: adenosylcobinamide-GDP ribazoletransferase [Candidatus Aureabacteria bacterium]|nr:adenosylcobinamide-GDP ribazoletransferase [Candidatus Auribacterota bacterium]
MIRFFLALQFLTIIPLRFNKIENVKLAESIYYFPLIGALLGCVLAALNIFLESYPVVSGIVVVISLIILTRGLHLDGLADTADALLSGKTEKEKLQIMRDPHIGAMGTLSLISVVLMKIALLLALSFSMRTRALILMTMLSRWNLVFHLVSFPYARQEGKAAIFFKAISKKSFIIITILTAISCIIIYDLKSLLIFGIIASFAYYMGTYFRRVLGGITGDTLGALVELTEIVALLMLILV